jgi:hypothetical protein
MIRESGYRFSEKIMHEQKDRTRWRFDEKPSRFGDVREYNAFHAVPAVLPRDEHQPVRDIRVPWATACFVE